MAATTEKGLPEAQIFASARLPAIARDAIVSQIGAARPREG